jgi:hypothetical protein
MGENRNEERSQQVPILAAETLRQTATAVGTAQPAKSEERGSSFWRIFGGTLLSIAALVVLTLCQHFNSSLNDLRNDLGHLSDELRKDLGHLNTDLRKDLTRLSESQTDLVKNQEFNTRTHSLWDAVKELQGLQAAVTALKERAVLQDQEQKARDERKELVREIQALRERLATMEGRQTSNGAVKTAVHHPE